MRRVEITIKTQPRRARRYAAVIDMQPLKGVHYAEASSVKAAGQVGLLGAIR